MIQIRVDQFIPNKLVSLPSYTSLETSPLRAAKTFEYFIVIIRFAFNFKMAEIGFIGPTI